MHGLVTPFLELFALAIILLLVGLFVLEVLVFATRVIVALIVLMTFAMSLVVTIVSVALMVVEILAIMLPVAQITAASNKKMRRLLLFWLLFLLDLVKDASCFIGSLTLLKKGNELKQVCENHLVCFCKLELMHLELHKEDLFAFLLRYGQLDCSTDVATVKVAEELYLMLH